MLQVPRRQATGQSDIARVQERNSLLLSVSIQYCSAVMGAVIRGLYVVSSPLLPLNPPRAFHEVGVGVELGTFSASSLCLPSVLGLTPHGCSSHQRVDLFPTALGD